MLRPPGVQSIGPPPGRQASPGSRPASEAESRGEGDGRAVGAADAFAPRYIAAELDVPEHIEVEAGLEEPSRPGQDLFDRGRIERPRAPAEPGPGVARAREIPPEARHPRERGPRV